MVILFSRKLKVVVFLHLLLWFLVVLWLPLVQQVPVIKKGTNEQIQRREKKAIRRTNGEKDGKKIEKENKTRKKERQRNENERGKGKGEI